MSQVIDHHSSVARAGRLPSRLAGTVAVSLILLTTGCAGRDRAAVSAPTAPPATVGSTPPAPTTLTSSPATTTTWPTTETTSPATLAGGGWHPVGESSLLDQLVTTVGTVIRVDPHRLDVVLIPGTTQPGGSFPEGAQVPLDRRAALVAATNAGFKRADARGGELVDGRTIGALVAGAASLVIRMDGTLDVGAWGGTVHSDPANVAVLQNLTLLVDGGQPAPDLSNNIIQRWGVSFRPALPVAVWRSGVGVDAEGRMLYAAGPNVVPAQLAQLLIGGGAVRAMQLDINHLWVFAALFSHPDPQHPEVLQGHLAMTGMGPIPDHVLGPGERDFLAVYRRGA